MRCIYTDTVISYLDMNSFAYVGYMSHFRRIFVVGIYIAIAW